MVMTTAFPTNPISAHRWPHDISIESSLLIPDPAMRGRFSDFLVQLEVDGEVEDDVDRLAVERARAEPPFLDCVRGGLVETERQRLEDLDVTHHTALVDDAL